MNGFAMLWSKTLDSSIWIKGSKETRLVWVTMLMMKDSDGLVMASKVGLADRAKVSEKECLEALRVLLSPDPDDTSKVEEGRRIREVPGGWKIVNHDFYRFSTEAKRLFWRETKAAQRDRDKLAGMTPEQRDRFEAGRKAEYGKRRKPGGGLRAAKKNGELAGARQAIAEGLVEAQSESGGNGSGAGIPVPAVRGPAEVVARKWAEPENSSQGPVIESVEESIPLGPEEPEE